VRAKRNRGPIGPLHSKPVICRGPLRSGVGADQCQNEPLPRDRWHGGVVPPAQLESIASLFDWNSLPPCPDRPIVFGQHKLIDVNLLPISGQRRFVVVGSVLMFFRRCWLGLFADLGIRLRSRVKEPDPETMTHNPPQSRVIAPAQRQHVARDFGHNRFVLPAVLRILFLGDN
jgi:hypothetical protein